MCVSFWRVDFTSRGKIFRGGSLSRSGSVTQSVMESVCQVLVKLDKVNIGGSRESPVQSYMLLYSLIYSCLVLNSPIQSCIVLFSTLLIAWSSKVVSSRVFDSTASYFTVVLYRCILHSPLYSCIVLYSPVQSCTVLYSSLQSCIILMSPV